MFLSRGKARGWRLAIPMAIRYLTRCSKMPVEKSAGVIVFYRAGEQVEYLLLKHTRADFWSFPKGLIEVGEKLEETARREAEEEAGLGNIFLLSGFKETIRFFMKAKFDYQLERGLKIGETVIKFVTYFLAEAKNKKIKLSFEHEDFAWLPFEQAWRKLKGNNREVLKKADEFLAKSL